MKHIFYCLWKAIIKTVDHDGVEHSGYMSFMIILAIFPFFVFILALTSFFGASELGEKFIHIIVQNIPTEATKSFIDRIRELTNSPPPSLLTLAIAGTIWTASSFVECLRTILNRVYEITSPPNYIFRRLLSIIQFLVITLAITITLLILVFVPIALSKAPILVNLTQTYIDKYGTLLNIIRYIMLYTILFLTVSSLYYMIPNAKISYKDVVPGALLCIFLWAVSGKLLSKYIIYYNQLSIVYGSLGSIIITLIFFYIINMIFIYGAEFNYLLSKKK